MAKLKVTDGPEFGKKMGTIADKTVFIRVKFGMMGNSRKVANNIVLKNDANSKLLKINQTLLESSELDAIRKADGQMRTYLYNMCLPYDMGVMLLPLDLLTKVQEKLSAFQDERSLLIDKFVDAYPMRLAEAKANIEKLSTEIGVDVSLLWKPEYYPTQEEIRGEFNFDWQYVTFATPETLKVMGIYEAEKAKAVEKMEKAAEEITVLMRQTLYELVNHLKTALEPNADGKPKRLFASTVTNIQEFLETFSARNITNDKELDTLVGDIQKIITPGLNVDTIRKDESFKSSLHSSIEDITGKLASLTEIVPGRKFRDTTEQAA